MRSFLLRLGFLIFASYGLLYFSYKFYDPDLIANFDFQSQYHGMYQRPLDFEAANAPFVYRQISAIITHTLLAAGVYYPTEIAFHSQIFPMIEQRVFFAALLTNYIGLVLASALSGSIAERETGGFSFPLLAGFLSLSAFHVQSAVITGLVEGITLLFFALLYFLYVRENRAAFAIVLACSIFQREMLPVTFGFIGAFSLLLGHGSKRYNWFVLTSSLLSFSAYLLVRTYIIRAPGFEEQLSVGELIGNLFAPSISLHDLVVSSLLTQNVLFIAVAISAVVWFRTRVVPKQLLILLLTLLGLIVVGLAEEVGNTLGRLSAMLTPALAAIAAGAFRQCENLTRATTA